MSVKNVLRLASVYSRASRMLSKKNFRLFRENRWEAYALYALAAVIGIAGGAGFGYLYLSAPGADARELFRQAVVGFYISLPTLCILYSLLLGMMFQVQRSGVRAAVQPVYWFPVTWGEHTAASVLSSTLTGSLWITLLLCAAVLAVSIPTGLMPLALMTSASLVLCLAITGTTIEAIRALQAGVSGAILKAAGRSAVWVRFFSMLIVFTVVYAAYFAVTQSSMTVLFASIESGQLLVWFLPYVWPGMALYTFGQGSWLYAALFSAGSVLFVGLLFAIAVRSNARYGFSDAPTIRVSSAYAPRAGLLSRLGFSAAESAIVKKDFRAFTRRSELMYVFIMPIVLVVATFMPMLTGGSSSSAMSQLAGLGTFYYLYLALLPAAALAMMLGMSVVGAEGERLWFLSASPISRNEFVRAKCLFPALVGAFIVLVCGVAGFFIFGPTIRLAVTGILEGLLLVFSASMVALACGIIGADFREVPRPRMVRAEWRLICMPLAAVLGLLVVSPVLVYGSAATFSFLLPASGMNGNFLYAAWGLSCLIALVVAYVFYRIAIGAAGRMMDAE